MNAYEFLGLEPGTTDEGAIRKAYAAALKAHRPDVDPAGFAKVRSAYQWVMARRAATEESEHEESEDEDSEEEDSGEAGVEDRNSRAEPDEEEAESPAAGDRAPVPRGSTVTPRPTPRTEPVRPPTPVTEDLDGLEDWIRAVLEEPDADPTRALAVARRLLRTPAALAEARFSGPGVALAARVAIDDPVLANRLGSAIYEVASPRERATLPFDEIDRRRRFSALCAGAAAATSRVVRAILEVRDPNVVGDADDITAFERDLGARVDGDPLLEWVLKQAPELPYAQRRLSRRASRTKSKTKQAVKESRRAPVKKKSGGAGIIYILLITVAGGIRACNHTPTPPPYRSPLLDSYRDSWKSRPIQYPLTGPYGDTSPHRAPSEAPRAADDPIRAVYDQVNAARARTGLPPLPYPPGIGPAKGQDTTPPK